METKKIYSHAGVVIVAGGCGRRLGAKLPKQFLLLEGEPVLARTIGAFASALPGASVVVVLPQEYAAFWRDLAARFDVPTHRVVAGGSERFYSVKKGIEALDPATELIVVQDGVRPLASEELIRRTVECAEKHGTAVPVVEPADSYRQITDEGSRVVDRSMLRIVQTPQVFRADWLREAYRSPYQSCFTDDASLVEQQGRRIVLCPGERTNLKITERDDLALAAAILNQRNTQDGEEGI